MASAPAPGLTVAASCDAVIAAIRQLRDVAAPILTPTEVERLRVAQDIAESLAFVER